MKFSRGKKRHIHKNPTFVHSEAENDLYERRSVEEPLIGTSAESPPRAQQTSRRQMPSRRRENDNRATNRGLLGLVLRIILIPALLVGGVVVLKVGLSLMEGPSEEDVSRWETEKGLMEKGSEIQTASPGMSEDKEIFVEKLAEWKKAERHFRAADALERRGIDDQAVSRLEQALDVAPENRKILHLLAELYMRSGNYAEVIHLSIRLLDQDSEQWDVKLRLLQALQAENKTESCVLLSTQMLDEEPNDVSVLEIAAYAYAALGDAAKALELYERILEIEPNHLLALEGAGFVCRWQNEPAKAVPYYLKLLDFNPTEEYYLVLAESYARQKEAGKTVVLLAQAAGLYGEPTVSSWLRNPEFDAVRETADFRAFADQMVGERSRAAIEEIRRREKERTVPAGGGQLDLPSATELQVLKPGH